MTEFYLLLLVPLVLQHTKLPRIDYQKKNKVAMGFFFGFFLILLCCRDLQVGTDTENYAYIFSQISNRPLPRFSEPSSELGFTFFCKALSYVSENSRVFFVVSSVWCVIPIAKLYQESNLDPSLTISLFSICSVFVMFFSGVRQSMTIAMGILAYQFVRDKRVVAYLITVAIACTIHNSAFLLLALYPVYYAKITPKWLYAVVPVMVTVFVFSSPIFGFLMRILAQFTRFDIEASATASYSMLILFIFLAVFSYLIPEEAKLDEETKGLRNLLLLVIVLQMFAPLHTLAMRMNYYFIVFIPALMPKIIQASKPALVSIARLGRHVMVAFFIAYFFFVLAPSKALNVFPYAFFWEG